METEELQSDKNNKEEAREIPKGTHKIIHSGFSQRKPRGATEMLHFLALCKLHHWAPMKVFTGQSTVATPIEKSYRCPKG